ncbi:rhodanese-like domain-containing protein [Myxococcaceae bacterium GXIMD 01537]
MTPLFDNAIPTVGGFRDVDVLQLARGPTPGVRLVDVREPDEFDGLLGHIEGAELVPLATVGAAAASWARDADVLLVCRSGGRSAKAAAQLAGRGFTHMMNLRGGMLAWNAASLPVARAQPAQVPTLAEVRDTLLARLHTLVAPEAATTRPSREALGAVLASLQAAGPGLVRDAGALSDLLREMNDWLAVARPGGA